MLFLAAANLWAHRRRVTGALAAVGIGVAFVTGTLLLSDTLRANFSTLFAEADNPNMVIVRGATELGTGVRQNTRAGVPAALLSTVRGEPGVADAQPYLTGFGKLLGSNGRSFVSAGPPTVAANWVGDPALTPYRLVAGHAPAASGQVVINRGAAKAGHLRLGDTTTVLVPEPVRVRIVGLATFGTADGFGPSTFTAFTLADAQRYLTAAPGQVSEILVRPAAGTTPAALATSLERSLPSGVQTITGARQGHEDYSQVNSEFLGYLRAALLVFAVIALVVGAFSIHNTLAIVAAQRSRESALLRSLGASRPQVLGAAVAESAALGLAGSALGVALGFGLAGLLKGVFDGFGFALPAGGLTVRASSITVAVALGLVVTVAAGASPALRAARTPPLAVVRTVDSGPEPISRRRRRGGAVLTTTGAMTAVGAATIGHQSGNMVPAALAALLLLGGILVLGPVVAGPAARGIGRLLSRPGDLTGQLSRENATRQPRRTAGTATTLLIGVTVVTLFTVVAASLKTSLSQAVSQSVAGEIVVGGTGFKGAGGLSPRLATGIAQLPQVQAATGLGTGQALLDGTSRTLTLADPAQLAHVIHLGVVAGHLAGLGPDQLAVSRNFAQTRHWAMGTTVSVTWPDGATGRLEVGALYTQTAIASDLVMSRSDFAAHDAQVLDTVVFVKLRPRADTASAVAAISRAATPYGRPTVQTRTQYEANAASAVNTMLGLVYVMLALSILIGLLGIANTLSLSVFERTRELGLLRALGQSRAQARSMIRREAITVSLLGTLAGMATGLLLGWAIVRSASGAALAAFAVPIGSLIIIAAVGAAAGVLAAIRPARRAAHLDILEALAVT